MLDECLKAGECEIYVRESFAETIIKTISPYGDEKDYCCIKDSICGNKGNVIHYMQTGNLDISELWKAIKEKYENSKYHSNAGVFEYYQTVKDNTQFNLTAADKLRKIFYEILYPEGDTSDGLTLEQTLDLL